MELEFIEGIDEHGNVMLISVDTIVGYEESEDEQKEDRKDKKKSKKKKFNEWIDSDGQYFAAKNTKIRTNIEPGYYSVAYGNNQYSAIREEINTDELFRLPNNIITTVVDEIRMFWDKKDLFEKNNIIHKRGILLHGGPGCGKTSLINILTQDVIERGGLVFHIKHINDLNIYLDFMHLYFREIEAETPIVTVIEDIDNLVNQNESVLLNFLDGEDQFEHNVVIATTNRIHEINDLLIRPSRFDWVIEVPPPTPEVRKFFLEKKGLTGEELQTWVDKSDKMSIAQLKEIFIAVKLLDNDIDLVVAKLRDQEKTAGQSTYKPKMKSVGFGN